MNGWTPGQDGDMLDALGYVTRARPATVPTRRRGYLVAEWEWWSEDRDPAWDYFDLTRGRGPRIGYLPIFAAVGQLVEHDVPHPWEPAGLPVLDPYVGTPRQRAGVLKMWGVSSDS